MPKDRIATYSGGARFDFSNKKETYGVGIYKIQYNGNSEMKANFGTGKIEGSASFTRQRVEDCGRPDVRTNLDKSGAKLALTGDIVSNGFTLDLSANTQAQATLAEVGITDLTATGGRRFYGTDAEAAAALVVGSSANYQLNGVIWGNVQKP